MRDVASVAWLDLGLLPILLDYRILSAALGGNEHSVQTLTSLKPRHNIGMLNPPNSLCATPTFLLHNRRHAAVDVGIMPRTHIDANEWL